MLRRREADLIGLGCVDSRDNVGVVLELVEVSIGRRTGV